MKNYLLIILLICAFAPFTLAQHVPQGMKYQAVARNLSGQVLANQPVTLKISLNSKTNGAVKTHYTETHTVTTNLLGLFDLTIGEGKVGTGTFTNVPWSTEDIWMEIAIQDGAKSGFSTVSSSRLLAVPYAFHAMTANQLSGSSSARAAAGPSDGVPSNVWSTFGNTKTDPSTDRMGTMDYADLIFVTNKTERLRITKDGDINIKTNLSVGNDAVIGNSLTVKKDVFLNTTGGSTINNGPLTVANGKPTVLTGTLNVNGATDLDNTLNVDGATTLKNTLGVDGAAALKSTLNVDGATTLKNTLNVNGNTDLDGTLNADGATTLKNTLSVDGATDLNTTLNVDGNTTLQGLTNSTNTTQSTNTTTGAITVAGGMGIAKNINVGGNANFGGSTTFGGIVSINDETESTNTTTGALIVAGGVGIGKRINVGGAAQFNNTLGVDGATTLKNTLNVNGNTDLDGTLNADGATTLKNTLSVDGATDLKSTLNAVGATTLKNTLSVDGAVNFNNTLTTAGATVLNNTLKVNGSTTVNKLDTKGQVTIDADVNGADSDYNSYPLRVQGSNQGIAIKVDGSRDNSTNFVTFMDGNGTWGRIEGQTIDELHASQDYQTQVAIYSVQIIALTADVAALGAETATVLAQVITAAEAVSIGAQAAAATAELAALSTDLGTFVTYSENNIGVTYESGSGDYAEWLERSDKGKDMVFGQIVGVKGGKISLSTENADHYMVVSKSPIVLGNMPAANSEKDYEKIAFMGQVPVRVVGKVAVGDYIIPSGNHDGLGIAVHPSDMQLGDYARIVGVAWQAAKDAPLNMVNVAVGINTNDLTSKMVAMSKRLDSLSQKTDNIMAYLQGKAPLQVTPGSANASSTKVDNSISSVQPQTRLTKTLSDAEFDQAIDKSAPQLLECYEGIKNQLSAKGVDVNSNPYLAAFFNDPIASVKQLRRDPTMSTHWGRFDQQMQKKTNK